jgi:hypothetical protein
VTDFLESDSRALPILVWYLKRTHYIVILCALMIKNSLTLSVTSIWDALKLCQYNKFVSKANNHSRNEQHSGTTLAVLTLILLFSRDVENFTKKRIQ